MTHGSDRRSVWPIAGIVVGLLVAALAIAALLSNGYVRVWFTPRERLVRLPFMTTGSTLYSEWVYSDHDNHLAVVVLMPDGAVPATRISGNAGNGYEIRLSLEADFSRPFVASFEPRSEYEVVYVRMDTKASVRRSLTAEEYALWYEDLLARLRENAKLAVDWDTVRTGS
jgi:hypothetical protein